PRYFGSTISFELSQGPCYPQRMTEIGLRERKKARTRRAIADAAALLFAERGYEQVAVSDVAREAEVSEQTVYNYFQTKEQLVTDLDQHVQDELSRLIRTRPAGAPPTGARPRPPRPAAPPPPPSASSR